LHFVGSIPSPNISSMAIARPIRVLALAAIGLWVFFIYQVFGPEKAPKPPGETLENMERDPLLDRMRPLYGLLVEAAC
jgi:mannosyltransferase